MTTALSSSMGAQMGMAQSQYAGQEVQDKSRAIDSLKRDLTAPKDKAKKLREACEGFESVFIQKMWEQMRATVPKGGMLQGRDEQYWQGMFDQELSKKMSSAGGIGLADMMYDQLSRNLVSASRTTASALGGANSGVKDGDSGFVASAAPLLPPVSQNTPPATATKGADSVKANAHGAIYGQEAAQPEATQLEAAANPKSQSQNPDNAALTASTNVQAGMPEAGTGTAPQGQVLASAGSPPASPTSPEIQQVLEQLRAQSGMGTTTMTGAQAIAAVQAMTPAQALSLSQGMSWSQVQAMHPSNAQLAAAAGVKPEMLGLAGIQGQAAMQGQATPSGLDNARAAAQTANTRMPAGGVLPPMTPMQRQARMNYSAAKVQGNDMPSQGHSPIAQPASAAAAPAMAQAAAPNLGAGATTAISTTNAQQASTMPMNPTLSSNVQGAPGVSPTKFVQNSSLIPSSPVQASSAQPAPVQTAGANPPSMGMTGEQIAALSGQSLPQAQPQTIGQMVEAAPMHVQNPAIPPTAQEPEIINTTFTTNVPPSRRNSRAGQRVPKGQAVIRTLNAGGQS